MSFNGRILRLCCVNDVICQDKAGDVDEGPPPTYHKIDKRFKEETVKGKTINFNEYWKS